MQTFRRWLDLIGCRVYGHHWYSMSGLHTEPNDEDGTLDVYLEIKYGKCKRCDALPEDPDVYDQPSFNISVRDYKIEATRGGVEVKIEHEVKVFDLDHDYIKSRTYERKAVKK